MRLLALILLFPTLVLAENMVAKDTQGNAVTLSTEKCVSSPWLSEWRTATFLYQGKQYAACWKIQGNQVVVLDSGGDVSTIPMSAFHREQVI